MSTCLEETNHVFLLRARRATPAPTPGRCVLISRRNNVDKNQFRFSFIIRLRAFMSIFHFHNFHVFYGRKGQAFGFFLTPFISGNCRKSRFI